MRNPSVLHFQRASSDPVRGYLPLCISLLPIDLSARRHTAVVSNRSVLKAETPCRITDKSQPLTIVGLLSCRDYQEARLNSHGAAPLASPTFTSDSHD
jgi:hypothetical protein